MKYMTQLFLSLCLLSGITATLAATVQDRPFEKVAENTWVIHGPLDMPNPANQGFMNNRGVDQRGCRYR